MRPVQCFSIRARQVATRDWTLNGAIGVIEAANRSCKSMQLNAKIFSLVLSHESSLAGENSSVRNAKHILAFFVSILVSK